MSGYGPSPQWQPPETPGKDAARSFLSGFAGCLGVGLAVVMVIFLLVLFASLAQH